MRAERACDGGEGGLHKALLLPPLAGQVVIHLDLRDGLAPVAHLHTQVSESTVHEGATVGRLPVRLPARVDALPGIMSVSNICCNVQAAIHLSRCSGLATLADLRTQGLPDRQGWQMWSTCCCVCLIRRTHGGRPAACITWLSARLPHASKPCNDIASAPAALASPAYAPRALCTAPVHGACPWVCREPLCSAGPQDVAHQEPCSMHKSSAGSPWRRRCAGRSSGPTVAHDPNALVPCRMRPSHATSSSACCSSQCSVCARGAALRRWAPPTCPPGPTSLLDQGHTMPKSIPEAPASNARTGAA